MTMDISLSTDSQVQQFVTTTINYGNDDMMIVEEEQKQRRTRSPSPTGLREQLQNEQQQQRSRSIIFGAFFRNQKSQAQQKQQQQHSQQQPIAAATPITTTNNNNRRSVRFVSDDENMIQEIEHVSTITDNERIIRWFTRQEYTTIKLQYNIIAKRMNTAACKFMNSDDDEIVVEQYDEYGILTSITDTNDVTKKDCTRGLEHKTREGSRRRSFNKHNALDAVLLEQQRQLVNSSSNSSNIIMDDKAIADVYMNEGRTAKESALILAAKDAKFAQKYGKQPITSSTSSPATMSLLNTKIGHFFGSKSSCATNHQQQVQQQVQQVTVVV